MSKKKQIFTDPQTGDEMSSTWLARLVVGAIWGLIIGVLFGVVIGLIVGVFCEVFSVPFGEVFWGVALGLGGGLFVAGLAAGMLCELQKARSDPFTRWIHDATARTQHRRRQRVLRSKEHQDVPDTALSRAHPPGEPQPTGAALSVADDPDEPKRLMVSIEDTVEPVVDDSA